MSILPWQLPGKGVFETMRSYDGKIFALDEHLSRMRRGLKILGITLRISDSAIRRKLAAHLKKKRYKNARVRLTVWHDKGKTYLAAESRKCDPPASKIYRRGFRVHVSRRRCRSGQKFCDIKPIRYEFYLNAYQAAQKRSADEAIILNTKKKVAEASRSNIFIVRDGVVLTPPLSSGCLSGITRKKVIRLGRENGYPVKETGISLNDLRTADEVFLTNSIMEIMPVTVCGKKRIGSGKPGPVTGCFRRFYRRETVQ